jgi:hypothetical protein
LLSVRGNIDKVLTFDDLSIGHGSRSPGGLEAVTHSDWDSVSAGESELLFASPSSLASGSTGERVWWGNGVADLCGRSKVIVWRCHHKFHQMKVLYESQLHGKVSLDLPGKVSLDPEDHIQGQHASREGAKGSGKA